MRSRPAGGDLDAIGRALERITSNPPALDQTGRRASARTTSGADDLAAVLRALGDSGIAVDEIGLRRPTLDEVFLALTGDQSASEDASNHQLEGSLR